MNRRVHIKKTFLYSPYGFILPGFFRVRAVHPDERSGLKESFHIQCCLNFHIPGYPEGVSDSSTGLGLPVH
jgi:hypothetical protein